MPKRSAPSQPLLGAPDEHSLLKEAGCPPNVAALRAKLFNVKDPLEMTMEEWKLVWPWVDNWWSRQGANKGKTYHSTILKCRFWRHQQAKSHGQGERRRKIRKVGEGDECSCVLTVRFLLPLGVDGRELASIEDGPVSAVRISRTKETVDIDHNHGIEDLDDFKRNSGLKKAAEIQVAKKYGAAVVAKNLRADGNAVLRQQLVDAGGQSMSRQDVLNAGRAYQEAYPDPRKVGGRFGVDEQVVELKEWLCAQPGKLKLFGYFSDPAGRISRYLPPPSACGLVRA
jgi:2,5-diamino-6-(ribosylamino)-4(3H)-pyrimidinone 5'-phosphate reductase